MTTIAGQISALPPPPYGERIGWHPQADTDFGDGGAYPEIHVHQYPLGLGKPSRGTVGQAGGTKALTLQTGPDGRPRYEALLESHTRAVTHARPEEFRPKWSDPNDMQKPSDEEQNRIAEETALALQETLKVHNSMGQLDRAIAATKDNDRFVRYVPDVAAPGYNPDCAERIIRVVEKKIDPLEPPKFQVRRAPRAGGDEAVPILRAPAKKLTAEDQAQWNIPPCVSNWKNQRGYTIPLEMRIQADGRGLEEISVNSKFAQFSEALYVAERLAREEIKVKNELLKQQKQREEEQREEQLREIAARARAERTERYGRSFGAANAPLPEAGEEEDGTSEQSRPKPEAEPKPEVKPERRESHQPSPSPPRHRSPSPIRGRRRSPSPVQQRRRSPLPLQQRRRSPSPIQQRRRSPSPLQQRRRSPSPIQQRRRSPSPLQQRRRSPSPIQQRRRSPSPLQQRRRSPSPLQQRWQPSSPIQSRRRSPSPIPHRRRSPSPIEDRGRGAPKFDHGDSLSSRRRSFSPVEEAERGQSRKLPGRSPPRQGPDDELPGSHPSTVEDTRRRRLSSPQLRRGSLPPEEDRFSDPAAGRPRQGRTRSPSVSPPPSRIKARMEARESSGRFGGYPDDEERREQRGRGPSGIRLSSPPEGAHRDSARPIQERPRRRRLLDSSSEEESSKRQASRTEQRKEPADGRTGNESYGHRRFSAESRQGNGGHHRRRLESESEDEKDGGRWHRHQYDDKESRFRDRFPGRRPEDGGGGDGDYKRRRLERENENRGSYRGGDERGRIPPFKRDLDRSSDHFDAQSIATSRGTREDLRQKIERLERLRKKEIEREFRLERAGRKGKRIRTDADRDVSEKVALGVAQPTNQEGMFDTRLFGRDVEGPDITIAEDDQYALYDRPLFTDRSRTEYRVDKERIRKSLGVSKLGVLGDVVQARGDEPVKFQRE